VEKEVELNWLHIGGMNNSFTNSQTLNTSEDFGGLNSSRYDRISIFSIGPFLVSRTGDAG